MNAYVKTIKNWLAGLLCLKGERRNTDYLRDNPDAATVIVECPNSNDLLTVHNVDGQQAIWDSHGTRSCFYLKPGEHVLSLSHKRTEINLAGSFATCVAIAGKDAEKQVAVKPGGQYVLSYDYDKKEYLFAEL